MLTMPVHETSSNPFAQFDLILGWTSWKWLGATWNYNEMLKQPICEWIGHGWRFHALPCWLNIHCIGPVSHKTIAHKVSSIRKWNHILKKKWPSQLRVKSLASGRCGCNHELIIFKTHIRDSYLEHFLWNRPSGESHMSSLMVSQHWFS